MADGKHCPSCGKDIGVWPIFAAGLPNRIWCPHCSARLAYREITGVLLLLVVMLAGVLTGAYFAALPFLSANPPVWVLVFAGVLLAVWVPIEFVVVGFLRRNRKLVRVDPSASEAGKGSG